MGAVLDDFTLIEDQDQIRVHYRLDPMGNNECRAIFHQTFQGGANVRFGFRIYAGGRVIQDQNAGVFQQRTGDGHPLLLAAGEGHAALTNKGVIAIWELFNNLMNGRELGCLNDFFIRNLAMNTIGDVLFDRAGEQEWLLLHDPDLGAEVIARVGPSGPRHPG